MQAPRQRRRSVRLLHTADLHVGATYATSGPGPLPALAALARAAQRSVADAVLVAGDFFDHGRVTEDVVRRAGELLERVEVPIAILPGNHDPYTAESPWSRHARHLPPQVRVLREGQGERIVLEEAGVQIWGQAHTHFEDFRPLARRPDWLDDGGRTWRVAMAHGLYEESGYEARFSWLFDDGELAALGADYVALGHLETHARVGSDGVHAWYASSPIRTGAFTRVDLVPEGIRVREVAAHGV